MSRADLRRRGTRHGLQGDADRALELLLEHGINHIDTAATADAELRIAPWLARARSTLRRHEDRPARPSRRTRGDPPLARPTRRRPGGSLQLHNLVDVIEWETALGEDGALEAAIEAREEGLVRFIGVTGHGLSRRPRCTGAASSASRSTRSCCRTTTSRCETSAMRQTSRRSPPSARSADVAATDDQGIASRRGTAARRRPRPGTSRCASRPTSTSPFTGCSAAAESFLHTVGDVTILPKVLDAASRYEERPANDTIDDLVSRRSLVALF